MSDSGDEADIAQTMPDPRAASSEPRTIRDPDAEVLPLAAAERYETRDALGEGGMGEVRLARDRLIGREVAMKLVRTDHAARNDLRQRFIREVRVQGQLEHPAIVPVYDFGLDARGDVFFTMRRVRGSTLAEIVDRLRANDEPTEKEHTRHKLLGAFVRVCLAVSFAHERGVVHRDLKPANIMLGGFGEVYVLDWGLAKVRGASRSIEPMSTSQPKLDIGESSSGDSGTTASGSVVGTPQYMAPEQMKGEDIDVRADVYSLGAILFELLTLEPLHGDGTIAETLKRAIQGADARASVRTPHRKVPPELEAICVRATGLARDARYANARELANAVDAYLAGDRDMELRRELARSHLELARAAAERARQDDGAPSDRSVALAEVGRALALAPSDADAMALLVSLLTEPPRVVPAGVTDAVDARAKSTHNKMLVPAALMYMLGWGTFVPVQALIGVKDWTYALMPLLGFLAAGALCLIAARSREPARSRVLFLIGIASALAIGLSSVIYGVFLALPVAVAINTTGTILVTPKDRRAIAIVWSVLALVVPIIFTWLDLHPVRHVFEPDGSLRVINSVLEMPRTATMLSLTATYLAMLGLSVYFAARYRDALTRAELANEMLVWQLRQLVPQDAKGASAKKNVRA
jgi:eukaryotic-like serine/threonine-protein kinase